MQEDVGKKIRKIRKQKGLTLVKLAARCGLSPSFLSQVEREVSSLSIISFDAICEALDVSIDKLLEKNYSASQQAQL